MGVPGTGVSYVKDHTGEQSKSAQKPEQRPYRTQALQDMETAEDTAARGGKYEPSRKDPGKKRGRKPRIALFIVILLVIYGGFQLLKNEISTGETVSAEDIPASAVWYPDSRVQFETYPGNVRPGDHVALSIDSVPRTRHTITVLVDGEPMQTTDLIARETDLIGHAFWHVAMHEGSVLPDCGVYYTGLGRAIASREEEKTILISLSDYALCMVTLEALEVNNG